MSAGEVLAQEASYRRGLLLGFTMAEMIIMIIFALLLALGAALYARETELELIKQDQLEVTQLLATVREVAAQAGYSETDFDDLFQELMLIQELRHQVNDLKIQLAEASRREALVSGLVAAVDTGSLAEAIATHAELKRMVIEESGKFEHGDATLRLEQLAEAAREADLQVATLRGRLESLRRRLGEAGRGTEMPSCWAVEDTGRPEYIFNVTLTSTGIVTWDNALPNRAVEQSRLPLSGITYGAEVTPAQFRVLPVTVRDG